MFDYSEFEQELDRDYAKTVKAFKKQFNSDLEQGEVNRQSTQNLLITIFALGWGRKFGKKLERNMNTNSEKLAFGVDELVDNKYDSFEFDRKITIKAREISELYQLSVGSAPRNYRYFADSLVQDVVDGKISATKARKLFNNFLKQNGTTTVTTLQGNRQMRSEAWFRMHSRTQTTKLYLENQKEYMSMNDLDVIFISKHTHRKPRKGCAPYEGWLISLSGNTKQIDDLDGKIHAVRTYKETSYGEPAGIFGINCTHISRIAYPKAFRLP